MKYQPPYGSLDPDASYVDRNTSAAVRGSVVPARAVELPQREIVNALIKSGIVPADDDLLQLVKAMRSQKVNYFVDGGAANDISISLDPVPSDWSELIGMPLRVMFAANNTGATTVAIAGLAGTRSVLRADGSALRKDDAQAGSIGTLIYDGIACRAQGLYSAFMPGRALVSYSVPGTYSFVDPDGIYKIYVDSCVGGGGGGGGIGVSAAGVPFPAGAGGAGGTSAGWIDVVPGQVISITIGVGGVGGAASATSASGSYGTSGSAGGTSSVGAYMSATGGGGGGATTAGTSGGLGGVGVGGQINQYGGNGTDGSGGSGSSIYGGNGGVSSQGGGRRSSTVYNATILNGRAWGSGGGSVYANWVANGTGGNGAPGLINLLY